MNTYWIAFEQDNPGFWGHEFSKHATCFSTFNVPCYGPEYRKHEEVVDFFATAVKYYKRFPTFKWLAEAQITPSNSTGYNYTGIRDVLFAKTGGVPFIGCNGPRYNTTAAGKGSLDNGYTALSEIWYYEYVSHYSPLGCMGGNGNLMKNTGVWTAAGGKHNSYKRGAYVPY
jgi:ribonuclease T2